jgi:hypothetical protein
MNILSCITGFIPILAITPMLIPRKPDFPYFASLALNGPTIRGRSDCTQTIWLRRDDLATRNDYLWSEVSIRGVCSSFEDLNKAYSMTDIDLRL